MGSYQLNFIQSGIRSKIDQDALLELKAILGQQSRHAAIPETELLTCAIAEG